MLPLGAIVTVALILKPGVPVLAAPVFMASWLLLWAAWNVVKIRSARKPGKQ